MLRIKKILILSLLFFFNACDSTTDNETTVILTVNAGSDKTVKINNLLIIKGEGNTSDGSQLSYVWKKNDKILTTSSILKYRPIKLGIDTLKFFAKHKSGEVIVDTVKVTVIDVQTNSEIPSISSELSEYYLKSINDARAKNQDCGVKGKFSATFPLNWNTKLYTSSYEHSYDMAYSKTFSHNGSGTKFDWTGFALGKKSVLSERIDAYNYNWNFIGENIGAGTLFRTPEEMVDGWLASDRHCANLMSSDFREVGMAMIKKSDTKYIYYWTQDFGAER